MKSDLLLLVITVVVALIFDFLNGFHDAANSIATVVSTRVLSPKLAVLWAAVFNFVAAFFLGTAVAKASDAVASSDPKKILAAQTKLATDLSDLGSKVTNTISAINQKLHS